MSVLEQSDPIERQVADFLERLLHLPGIIRIYARYQVVSPDQKKWVLAGAVAGGLAILLGLLYLVLGKIAVWGFVASLLAGLATGLGALPALFMKDVPAKLFSTLLGSAAGVMLAATAFSLIVPGTEYGNDLWPGKGVYVVALGMLLGAVFLDFADRKLPHPHIDPDIQQKLDTLRKIWLFIAAITVHNFPEGLAVGVSFGAGDVGNGIALAIAIGLQNMPEGLAVSMPLVALGYSPGKAVLIGTLTGLVEPIGGLLGVTAVTVFYPILPVAMGFAAGAMLFVITEDIIPETHANGKARVGTFGLMGGFLVMLLLESLLS